MKKAKRIISTLLLLSLVLASALMVSCEAEPDGDTGQSETEPTVVRAIKAKKDIKKGTVLSAGDLDIAESDESELPDGYVAKTADAVNRKLLSAVKAGEFLTTELLSEKTFEDEDDEKLDVDNTLARKLGYVVVTDYVDVDTGEDLSEDIQNIIDNNPRKTIYFPDGVYTIAYPIKTSSSSGKAVSLHLSMNAVIRASDRWKGKNHHMIQLGVIDKSFDIHSTGTNYYLYGGVIDGNGRANGVALEGGRETSIRNVTIKNVMQGLHIVYNEVYSSNDSDTEWVNIEGCGIAGTVGVQVDGLDNTLSNMRISGFETGVRLTNAGNLMHNIYTRYLQNETQSYDAGRGFYDTSGGNWYDACRAEDFKTAFFVTGGSMSIYNDCGASWSVSRGRQIAIETDGKLNAVVTNIKAEFCGSGDNALLVTYADGGNGIIKDPAFDVKLAGNETYKKYLVGRVVWSNS